MLSVFECAPRQPECASCHRSFEFDVDHGGADDFRLDHLYHPKMLFLVRGLNGRPFAQQKLFGVNVICRGD